MISSRGIRAITFPTLRCDKSRVTHDESIFVFISYYARNDISPSSLYRIGLIGNTLTLGQLVFNEAHIQTSKIGCSNVHIVLNLAGCVAETLTKYRANGTLKPSTQRLLVISRYYEKTISCRFNDETGINSCLQISTIFRECGLFNLLHNISQLMYNTSIEAVNFLWNMSSSDAFNGTDLGLIRTGTNLEWVAIEFAYSTGIMFIL